MMRRLAIVMVLGLLALSAAALYEGGKLSAPAPRYVGLPPPDLAAESVILRTADASFVSGWLVRGRPGAGAVLLLHGVRSNRLQMVGRARFLKAAGYSVLLIDLQAHGASPGDHITFGAREGAGVIAALSFLRRTFPGEPVGVIGVSLGAASVVLARPQPAPDALIIESMYPTIEDAVADRLALRFGAPGRVLGPLLLWQLPMRLGVSADQLQPIAALPTLHVPVLVMAGTRDLHTRWAETRRIYAAAAAPKQLWGMTGAGHVDLYGFAPGLYRTLVLTFLSRHMHSVPTEAPQALPSDE